MVQFSIDASTRSIVYRLLITNNQLTNNHQHSGNSSHYDIVKTSKDQVLNIPAYTNFRDFSTSLLHKSNSTKPGFYHSAYWVFNGIK